MIKCKDGANSTCGKDCCCFDCDEMETCKETCSLIDLNKITDPSKCDRAIVLEDGNEMVAFENHSLAIIQTIADIASKKKELEDQDKEMRKQLEFAMDQYGVKSFENDLIKITYVEPTTRTSVDSAKLKKKYPDIYDECSKTSNVKGSVRITVK